MTRKQDEQQYAIDTAKELLEKEGYVVITSNEYASGLSARQTVDLVFKENEWLREKNREMVRK